jgi:hypothetical protein
MAGEDAEAGAIEPPQFAEDEILLRRDVPGFVFTT